MVHQYRMNGYNIVMDVNSGAIHTVDDVAYDVISLYETDTYEDIQGKLRHQYDEKQIKESYEEIDALVRDGLLFTKEDYKDYIKSVEQRNPVVKALCLHVAHDCNLRCRYCFAEEGEYHGKRSMMSLETGKKALDFIVKNSGWRKNLEIDFFGGEPLMNFDVVKDLVAYGRKLEKENNKHFRFTITTNGVLLDEEKMDFINAHMHNLVLSLDGRKEIHDYMRKTVNGQGSYDLIAPKMVEAVKKRGQKDYYVRATFTKENLDFSEDVIHMADLGFKQISIEPVVTSDSEDYAITDDDLNRIEQEYELLAIKMLQQRAEGGFFNFFHFMIDLTGGPCVAKRLVGCGAGTEYLAVTPEGDLYPCHQFVGMTDFKMGTVEEGISENLIRSRFENVNVYTKEDCTKCWAKFYCSGGCAANAYNMNGDLLKPYLVGCKLQQKRTECAIMMKIHESMAVDHAAENEAQAN